MLWEDFVVLGLIVVGAWCSYQMTVGFEQRRCSATDERLSELATLVRSQQAQMTELKLVIHHQRRTIDIMMAAQNHQNSVPLVSRRVSSPTCIMTPLSTPWNS